MGINSIGYSGSLFGQAVLNLNNQLTNLSTELATGEKSTTYAGMGVNEGFAVAARAQLSNISAFGDTITNVNTIIGAANTALQSLTRLATTVQGNASTTSQDINSSGQTIGQQNAQSQLVSMIGILNTQVGNRYIFSGSAINTPAVASSDAILNGSGTQAGLKQLIAERAVADGTTGLGRLVISTPATTGTAPATTTAFSISEDTASSPFGLKLSSASSTTTAGGAASTSPSVSGPSGSPASVSFSFGSTNPSPGDQVTLNFNLPDGTTASVQLTASSANPPPSGSYAIGSTPAATAANLNSALNTAIGTLANTTLVAASAVAAGNDFFDPSSSATGAVADSQAGTPITTSTTLSGSGNALAAGFANGDTLTVNGMTISFSSTAPTNTSGSPYVINTGGTVGNLLSAIDSITGATTPSSIDGGAVTINTPNAASFSISTSSSGVQSALAALGFSSSAGTATTASGVTTVSAVQPPLRVSSAGSVTGAAASDQQATPQAITSATALSGAAGSASLSKGFANGDSITVDGSVINFSNTVATSPSFTGGGPYTINTTTSNVGNLLSAINQITGGTSSIDARGAITINTPNAANFSITTSASDPNAQAALGALGFSSASGTATSTGGGGSVTGAAELDQQAPAQPIATSTALSGTAPSASLTAGFQNNDAITVNGTTITFSTSSPTSLTGPTYNIDPTTGTVGNLLSAIDSITGTTTPSSITGGAVSINTPSVASFSISASASDPTAQAALAALGFSPGSTTIAATGGTNITANATSLVNGSADTVAWYTGNNSPDPRATSTALVDSGISAEYGMQANEQAIRQQLEGVAVYAAMTESPTAKNSSAQANALSSRIATNMTSQPGQQQISDIQTDLANAQTTMKSASARQTQSQTMLQNMIDSTETVSTEQVASEILAIQSSLSASYQTTSILSKLTLTSFLAPGA